MKKPFSFWQFSALILLCTGILSTGIFLYVNKLNNTLHEDMRSSLNEVAKQGANTIHTQVKGDLELLRAVATVISVIPQPTEQIITSIMQAESKANHFKRMGFVYPNGMAVLSDNLLIDISQQPHFVKALGGEANVSGRIVDSADGKDIIVEAVPVWHGGKIIGVLFATRSTEEYARVLDVDNFAGEGYSIIVRSNGDKIVGSEHKNAVSGMLNIFNTPDDPDHILEQKIRSTMEERQGGSVHYNSAERGTLHISYEPLHVNDWYLFSVVPTAQLTKQANAFISLSLILCLAVAIAGLAVWAYLYLQQKKSRQALFNLAYVDPVTGFPNTRANNPLAEQLLRQYPGNQYAVVAFDISKFKIFNEQHGFETGDILLTHIAKIVNSNLEADESFTRIYADYFAMLLKYTTPGELKNRLERLSEQITSFQTENNQAYPLLLSFGVYPVTERAMPLRMMYNRAMVAKSQAKGQYADFVSFYNPKWQKMLVEEEFIERQMQQALSKKEFRFFLEPVVRVNDGKITAAEAASDWPIPGRSEPLTARQFLPVFRKNGFILQYDWYLLEAALATLAQWKKDASPLLPIVLNFSNEHLYDAGFIKKLLAKTEEYEINPAFLILELTESNRADFLPQLKRTGRQLMEAGFGLTVRYDGNGVTLSNIFQHLPVEGMKIGPGVWTAQNPKHEMIMRGLVELCRQLGIFLAADGILNPNEWDRVKDLGFEFAQGPLAAPALTPQDLAKRLKEEGLGEVPARKRVE